MHRCDIGSWDAVLPRVRADETIVVFFGQKASNPLLYVKNSRFGWFRTIWLPQVHRCDIVSWDAVLALVRSEETIVEFLVKTHAIHYFRSSAYVLGGFAPFGCRKCTVATSGPGMSFCHEFGPTKLLSSFSVKKHPIHYFRSKNTRFGWFRTIWLPQVHRCDIGS